MAPYVHVSCFTSSSAAMVFTVWHERVLFFPEEGLKLPAKFHFLRNGSKSKNIVCVCWNKFSTIRVRLCFTVALVPYAKTCFGKATNRNTRYIVYLMKCTQELFSCILLVLGLPALCEYGRFSCIHPLGYFTATRIPFYKQGSTAIAVWTSNHIHFHVGWNDSFMA